MDIPEATMVMREHQLDVALDAANKEIAFLRQLILLLAKRPTRRYEDE